MPEQILDASDERPTRAALGAWLALALVVIVLDQASKAWIVGRFALGEGVELLPVFGLLHTYNTGAAFSFLRDAGGWQRWFFTAVAFAASVLIVRLLSQSTSVRVSLALSMILGGAIGNVIDRIARGHVIDFLHAYWGPHSFPVFNLADCAITLGAILLIVEELVRWRKR